MSKEELIEILKQNLRINIKESETGYGSRDKYVDIQLLLFGEVISEDSFKCLE